MDKETAKIIKTFAHKVREKYKAQVILFGSRARGDNFKKSDFDFLIISEKFRKIPYPIRASGLYDFWDYHLDFEPLCLTPDEFERKKKQIGTIRQAVKEGILVN
ncbi:nucleotidyltransferase domain-containing protein [Candidatus Woesearchaeota archaeon]|nr:nucleotidyltransferase domain-containing protein [Candidatus Woesearchaeota archaeon]